jgi:hypothetical protein
MTIVLKFYIVGHHRSRLATRRSEKESQEHIDIVVAKTNKHIEVIRASKALEGLRWEPATYSFVRCERDAVGLNCERHLGE